MATAPHHNPAPEHAPNAEPGEIGKFDGIAARFWDEHGPFRPLHQLNPVRVRFITERAVTAGARALGEHLLRAAAALGITALAASGDLGFQGCQENAVGADWPASSRYVTAVGGAEGRRHPGERRAALDHFEQRGLLPADVRPGPGPNLH